MGVVGVVGAGPVAVPAGGFSSLGGAGFFGGGGFVPTRITRYSPR